MIKKKVITLLLALTITVSTCCSSAYAMSGNKAKKTLEYGAFGAAAGYLLPSHHNSVNTLKGAALGSAIGLLFAK